MKTSFALVLPALIAGTNVLAAASISKRATAALAQLNTAATLVTTGCTTTCAAMVASSSSCADDTCACAADAQVQSCFSCTVVDTTITTAQLTQTQTTYNAYMGSCLSEGEIQAVLQVPGITVTATSTSLSSSLTSSSSSSSSRSSSSSSSSASVTTTALTAQASSATTVYTIMTSYVNSVYSSDCTTQCTAFTNDFYNCNNDGCVCSVATIQDMDTCQNCMASDTNAFSTTQLATLKSYWSRAVQGCASLNAQVAAINTATVTGTGTGKVTGTSSKSSTATGTLDTAIPVQSYYAPTTTTKMSTTSGVVAQATVAVTGTQASSASKISMGRNLDISAVVGVLGLVLFSVWW